VIPTPQLSMLRRDHDEMCQHCYLTAWTMKCVNIYVMKSGKMLTKLRTTTRPLGSAYCFQYWLFHTNLIFLVLISRLLDELLMRSISTLLVCLYSPVRSYWFVSMYPSLLMVIFLPVHHFLMRSTKKKMHIDNLIPFRPSIWTF
jgi:hypothetical protein